MRFLQVILIAAFATLAIVVSASPAMARGYTSTMDMAVPDSFSYSGSWPVTVTRSQHSNGTRNPDVERRPLPAHLAGALDLHRIGIFGQSLGGATAAQVMVVDSRIRAGLSLDGPIPSTKGAACIAQPIMLIRSVDPTIERLTVPSWSSAAHELCGWHLSVTLRGSGHNDFTDLTIFARELALGRQQRAAWSLGSIDAGKAVEAERAYVTTFFERWLGNRE